MICKHSFVLYDIVWCCMIYSKLSAQTPRLMVFAANSFPL